MNMQARITYFVYRTGMRRFDKALAFIYRTDISPSGVVITTLQREAWTHLSRAASIPTGMDTNCV